MGVVLRALVTTLYRTNLANGLTCIAHSMQLATDFDFDFFLLPLSVVGPLEKKKITAINGPHLLHIHSSMTLGHSEFL